MRITDFSSTQEFIRHAYARSKQHNPALSIARYAERLGIGHSSLKMIMSGKRRPTVFQVLSVAQGLRLSEQETSFLESLALKESAKPGQLKSRFKKVLASKRKEIRVSTVSTSRTDLIHDPFTLPLLVYLLENKGRPVDYPKLARSLRVSEAKIIATIEKLTESGILENAPAGYHVAFDKLSHRMVQRKYQKAWLAEAARRVDEEYDNPTSLFLTYTFSASPAQLIELQSDLKRVMDKHLAAAPTDDSQIAQACFQVFPVIR